MEGGVPRVRRRDARFRRSDRARRKRRSSRACPWRWDSRNNLISRIYRECASIPGIDDEGWGETVRGRPESRNACSNLRRASPRRS